MAGRARKRSGHAASRTEHTYAAQPRSGQTQVNKNMHVQIYYEQEALSQLFFIVIASKETSPTRLSGTTLSLFRIKAVSTIIQIIVYRCPLFLDRILTLVDTTPIVDQACGMKCLTFSNSKVWAMGTDH